MTRGNDSDITSLGAHAVKGSFWLLGLKGVHRGLGFVRTIILARLLSPGDFGLMGIAVLAINMLETFSKTGFEQALIQKKEDIREYLDTAWTIQLARSVLLFLLLFFGAPMIAGFFASPESARIIRVLALIELFMGLRNPGTVFFPKRFRFDKKVYLELSGLIPNMTVSILLAFVLRDVWALVYGSLAGALCMSVTSYFMHSYRPSFKFEPSRAKELLKFGKWLFGSSILIFLVTQGDDAFVGKMLGITALGLYQMAYHISNSFTTEFTHVISQAMFPAYSRLQNDLVRLSRAYAEVFQVNMFFAFFVFSGILVFAGDFTRIVLGEKWMPIVPLLRILASAGFLRSVASTTGIVFQSIGKPRVDTLCQSLRLIVLGALIFPFSYLWGMKGVSFAVLASILAATTGFFAYLLRELPLDIKSLSGYIAWPAASSVCVVLGITLFRGFTGEMGIPAFAVMVVLAMALYFGSAVLWERLFGYGIYGLMTERIKKGIR